MSSHVCEASQYKNQGRCIHCGKFMPKGVYHQHPIQAAPVLPSTTTSSKIKADYIDIFKNNTCLVEYVKNGQVYRNMFSLQATYLKEYQGKGTSKKSDDDTLFLYDVDA